MHPHDRDSLPCHWPRRWDEAARGAGRAHDGAGVCVRSCNHVCRGGFSTDTSMGNVSHTSYGVCRERAALHAAVPDALVHGRPGDAPVLLPCCCRRRRGDTDYSRASGACSAQPEPPRACTAALLVLFRDGRRAPAGQPPPTSLPKAIYATTPFRTPSRARTVPGTRNEEARFRGGREARMAISSFLVPRSVHSSFSLNASSF